MKIKAIYRKNLKMSEGKVAAQVAHAVKNLGWSPADCTIVVLKVSDKKFGELTQREDCYVQVDMGFTEVEEGTATAAAWVETGTITPDYPEPQNNLLGAKENVRKYLVEKQNEYYETSPAYNLLRQLETIIPNLITTESTPEENA